MNEIIKKNGNGVISAGNIEKKYLSIKVLNEKDVFLSKNTSLALMSKNVGEINVKALLAYVIADLVKFFNVGKMMTTNQIAATVELILEDVNFSRLKIDDFKLCFNRAKKGEYGAVYDRIDGQVIFNWLNIYFNQRIEIADNQSYSQHIDVKNTWADLSGNR